ncbi:conserved exported hypothetical protein [Tenacibaculum litopenaei]|uniref:carboxypeptidase-like regulatory domain-containing protein n=1 Tax=Tenacibaculum litopenaei TaxID=396016 RepID=UPI0038961937
MGKSKLCIALLLLCGLACHGQAERKFMYAAVKDKIGPVADAHIINLKTGIGTFTNVDGAFRIKVQVNDSLRISNVGYKTVFLVVAPEDFGIHEKEIQLHKESITLDEVDLNKTDLVGHLLADSKRIKKSNEVNAISLKLPYAGTKQMTKAEKELHTASAMSFALNGGLSFDPILNWMSGRTKMLKKLKAIEDLEIKINYLREIYTDYIVMDLEINRDDLDRFLYYTEAQPEFNAKFRAGKMAMIPYFKTTSDLFKNLNPTQYTNDSIKK